MLKPKNIDNKVLRRYITKFIRDIKKHNFKFYKMINEKLIIYDCNDLAKKMEQIIQELTRLGLVNRRYYYPLCQCVLYGILFNKITFISMNSSALIKNNKTTLRKKPQYLKIKKLGIQIKEIENRISIPINYISILPDYSKEFPFEVYDDIWEENKSYLEQISEIKAYRLSQIYQKDLSTIKKEIISRIDIKNLEKIISYYQNNKFIKLGFSASADFQRNQILNYTIVGSVLEKQLPFTILLDVQKKNFPFEQKFYNYARIDKLPIIFCGQD